MNSTYNKIIEENRGVKLNEKSKLRLMQYISLFVLIGLVFGGLGIITDWTFFIPKSNNTDLNQAIAESALDIMIFNANPSSIALGQKADLIWSVSGASSVIIDPGIGTVGPAGKQTVTPDKTTTYTIVATNSTGTITKSVTVGVDVPESPPIITSFTASATSATAGQPVTLKWSTSGASSASIDQGIGLVAANGVVTLHPNANVIWTLMASNPAGAVTAFTSCNVTAISLPVISSFTLTPTTIRQGESSSLKWAVTGEGVEPDSVTIDPGIGNVSNFGTLVVSPGVSTVYTLTVKNWQGKASSSLMLAVTPTTHPAINSFIATPASIKTGQSATLQWNISGATSVSISPGVGIVASAGTAKVSPAATTVYTITASNPAGSITGYATVTVSK